MWNQAAEVFSDDVDRLATCLATALIYIYIYREISLIAYLRYSALIYIEIWLIAYLHGDSCRGVMHDWAGCLISICRAEIHKWTSMLLG
jgi:hypothetical protein